MKLCAIQLTSGQNIEENLKKAEYYAQQACIEKSDLIVLPEMYPYIGEPGDEASWAVPPGDTKYIDPLLKLSAEYKNTIVCGSIPVISEKPSRIYNRSYTVSHGKIAGFYDKINLFDIDIKKKASSGESLFTVPGTRTEVFSLPGFNLGIAVCFDLRFPALFNQLRKKGSEIIALPAAFLEHTGKDHWEILLRARAIETQSYIIAADQFGRHTKSRKTYGRSMIIDPWGTILACAPDEETNIYSNISKDRQARIRQELKML